MLMQHQIKKKFKRIRRKYMNDFMETNQYSNQKRKHKNVNKAVGILEYYILKDYDTLGDKNWKVFYFT